MICLFAVAQICERGSVGIGDWGASLLQARSAGGAY